MKVIKCEKCGAEIILEDNKCEQADSRRERLLVCGIGGSGCNMTRYLQKKLKREGTDYLLLDTDKKCLDAVPEGQKILIGESTCHGTGTGRYVQKGKEAALESKPDITEALTGYTFAVILFGVGGGTGSGAGLEVVRIAKEMGIETAAFVIKPFSFEAKIRNETAQECLDVMRDENIRFVVLDNERFLQRSDMRTGMAEFFEHIDDIIVDFVEKIPVRSYEGQDMREELIKTFDESAPKEVNAERILDVVCDYFHVTKDQVLSKTRNKGVVKARRVSMYFCKYVGGYSLNATGAVLGSKNEAAVRRGIHTIVRQYKNNKKMKTTIDAIRVEISN